MKKALPVSHLRPHTFTRTSVSLHGGSCRHPHVHTHTDHIEESTVLRPQDVEAMQTQLL